MKRVVILSLLTAVVVGGCSETSGGEPDADRMSEGLAPDAVAERYGYDVEQAEMTPVYELVPAFRDPNDPYARDLLAAECLKGVIEYRAHNPHVAMPFMDLRSRQPIFNLELATEFGYPYLRETEETRSMEQESMVDLSDEQFQAMVECGEKTDERLGKIPDRILTVIEDAGWEYSDSDTDLIEAIEGWRTCMDPLGIPDMHDQPNPTPPKSVVPEAFEATEIGDHEVSTVPLTDREREVAIADAKCREKVDYDFVLHAARAEGELIAIGSDIESFEAARVEAEKYQKKIEEVLAELG